MHREPIPTARELMQRKLVTVRPDEEIEAAVRRLSKKGHSGAPVVEEDDTLVGVLSEHDCIRVMAQSIAEGWPSGRVATHMSTDLEIVRPDEDALALSTRFTQGHHRRLLVVEDGRLVGLVSRRDLMRALEDLEKRMDRSESRSTYDVISERHRDLD